MNAFFIKKNDTILPLLPKSNMIHWHFQRYRLANSRNSLRAELKPHQLEGLSFLAYLDKDGVGGVLGDEMGLGKTLQKLALSQHLREKETLGRYPAHFLEALSFDRAWILGLRGWKVGSPSCMFSSTMAHWRTTDTWGQCLQGARVNVDLYNPLDPYRLESPGSTLSSRLPIC